MLERTVRAAGPELLAPAPIPVTGLVGSPISPWVRKGRYSPLSGLDSTAARPDALPAGSTSGIPTDQASLTRPTDTPTVNNRQGGLDARVRGPVVWTIEPMTPEHESFDKHDQAPGEAKSPESACGTDCGTSWTRKLPAGMAVGLALGVVLGLTVLDNIAVGVGFGMGIGIAVAVALGSREG